MTATVDAVVGNVRVKLTPDGAWQPATVGMVLSQGAVGYGLTSVMGPIVIEIFEGPRFGSIFGTITVGSVSGGAAGPWVAGVLYDSTGSYSAAFWIAAACSVISMLAIWLAAPGRVRAVAGRVRKLAAD